jgi:hypothetical protein
MRLLERTHPRSFALCAAGTLPTSG